MAPGDASVTPPQQPRQPGEGEEHEPERDLDGPLSTGVHLDHRKPFEAVDVTLDINQPVLVPAEPRLLPRPRDEEPGIAELD